MFFNRRVQRVLWVSVFFNFLALGAVFADIDSIEDRISPDLQRVLDNTENPVPVIVVMKPVTMLGQTFLGNLSGAEKEQMLRQRALRSQVALREYVKGKLSERTLMGEPKPLSKYLFMWATNGFMATATPESIMEMAEIPGVERIILDRKIKLAPDFREEADIEAGEFTYGLEKIGIPQIRSERPEITGKGVVVGIIDTGLDGNHPEVSGRVLAFKDFVGSKTTPYDDNGHGTHVAGTIGGRGVGGTQIGVAPEVSFVIAKAFTGGGSGSLSGLLRAMEWMADPDGNPQTNDRPRVISNSWGGGSTSDASQDPFFQAVTTWVELNMFPSFAAGNSGPSAETVGSPGCLPNAFAVGATDSSDAIARFSSRGPVKMKVDGRDVVLTKPDVSAPGVDVYSAMPGGKYAKMSGTSMATPHVSGVIALLYQVKPDLKISEVMNLLMTSADKVGGGKEKDNKFGAGRVNVPQTLGKMGLTEFDQDPWF